MEEEIQQEQPPQLEALSIDRWGQQHLSVAAQWAKFLGIFGLIFCGLLFIVGIVLVILHNPVNRFDNARLGYRYSAPATRTSASTGITYIFVSILHFFPSLFLLQFGNKMQAALGMEDQLLLNDSLQSLKKTFRFVGVLAIIGLILYACIFLFAIIGMALR